MTQTGKTKVKNYKGSTKQTKTRLPRYKNKNRLVRGKRKSVLKCLNMNSSSSKTKRVQGGPSSASLHDKQPASERLVNRRKKNTYTIVKGSSTKTQHSMGLFVEQNDDSKSARDRDHKQYDITQHQRNLGSPVIVETLLESLSSLSIPEILRQNQKAKVENTNCHYKLSKSQSTGSRKSEARIIVAESVNPNDISSSSGNDTRRTSPLKNNHRQRKNKTQSDDINLNDFASEWNSSETTLTFEKCLSNFDTINRNSSILEVKTPPATIKRNRNSILDDQCQPRFYSLKDKVVVVMPEKSRFCFTGKLVLKVLYGAVEAYGCVITRESKPIEIYSPKGYSSVSIETSQKFSPDNETDIWTTVTAEGIIRGTKNKLVDDIDKLQPGTAVILLTNLENKLTKFLNVFYPLKLFPKIRNVPYQGWTDPKRAEMILQSNLYVDGSAFKELVIDKRMTQDVSEKMLNRWHAKEWSCTLIAGGKNVGKSTATRYLINSLLPVSKMVVLVDVDPGQTESTPPGCISYSLIEQPLMGPNFTHLSSPAFQLYIGDVNVSRCITRYIEGIKVLMDKLLSCPILSRLPIVVNTMGFCQGIGWDIILFTIKLIRPFLVVQIMSDKSKNNYPDYLKKQVVNKQELLRASWTTNIVDSSQPCDHELCVVRSQAERKNAAGNESQNLEPYQQRELVMISYLSEIIRSPVISMSCYDTASLSITEAVPYVTSFSSLFISLPRTTAPPTHVLNVVNGNIVALCGIDGVDESREIEYTSGLRVLTRLPLCTCYGFGIVRGIDTEREEVYINTPLSPSMMQHVNCLAGCIPVPVTLLQLNQHRNAPYTGGNNVLPTSREPRRGYFRMRPQQAQSNS
ncbi:polynucleotide 5'-hydroxyl-kinase NOL9 [Hylaeus anthracinus]|uniref:polynucleotide 5'-hydroxyl-kinase NOL9 n=1 Tax=Hylaeus anthracinus TaxID=313031 RepID=UPI0023B91BA4|nr:polynucleotide 5'-hydroxyl-kinase NOL9 [Hylaeus anthracinus]